jgi:hypothetical protein
MKNTYIPIEVNKQNKVKTWYLDVTNLGLEELISLKNELNDLIRDVEILEETISHKTEQFQRSCDHKDESGKFTVDYDSFHERRSSQMHCRQCNKGGSIFDLTGFENISDMRKYNDGVTE